MMKMVMVSTSFLSKGIRHGHYGQVIHPAEGRNRGLTALMLTFGVVEQWFDQKKEEGQSANNTIDWRFSGTSTIRNAFLQYLATTKRDSSGKQFR
jgi:hypothetical protein